MYRYFLLTEWETLRHIVGVNTPVTTPIVECWSPGMRQWSWYPSDHSDLPSLPQT